MPTNEISLKQKNLPYLWSFFFFNLIIFLSLFFSSQIDLLLNDIKVLLTFRTIGVCIAPLLIFVLNGLVTSQQKGMLVFWRHKNILPGYRAFSYHARRDDRINLNRLSEIHQGLPTDEKEQNKLWYKIFKLNSSDISVTKSHKDFLLARDMASMAFLFLLFLGLPCLFFLASITKWVYFLVLVCQYLLMVRLAQNHGRRFVRNVLAIESIK